MFHTFYITVRDNKTKLEYTFDGYIDKDDNDIQIYIGDTKNFRSLKSCVHITVTPNSIANLNNLSHVSDCDINKNLQEGLGTNIMLKGSLKFVINSFPHIKKFVLTDTSIKKGTRILLTPKRIILGETGWYQKHFGAVPTEVSKAIIKSLNNEIKNIDKIMVAKLSWGTPEDLKYPLNKLDGLEWEISRKIIENYDVSINVENASSLSQDGGSISVPKWVQNAKRRLKRYKLKFKK